MKLTKLLLVFACAITTLSQAEEATIQLFQYGWDSGGPLTISFTGNDQNANRGIDIEELLSFTASFPLPGAGTADFSLPDLGADGFFYSSTEDYFIKVDSPNYSLYDDALPGGSEHSFLTRSVLCGTDGQSLAGNSGDCYARAWNQNLCRNFSILCVSNEVGARHA